MKIIWTESAQQSQDAAATYIFDEFALCLLSISIRT